MELRCKCSKCSTRHEIIVREIDYSKWKSGATVGECFPYLPRVDKEWLTVGVCQTCFDNILEGD